MDITKILRPRPVRLLIAASLLMSLGLGWSFITVHRSNDLRGEAVEAPAHPLTDDQTMQQVLSTARTFIGAGRLKAPTGTYILMSCNNNSEPPYQGSVYLNFDVPTITETPAYFREIARSMAARGWAEGEPPNHHPGGKLLAKEAVTALYYRHPDIPGRAVMQIYGQCRDVADHRLDTTGFIDITRDLRR